jgi:hypothetical protein
VEIEDQRATVTYRHTTYGRDPHDALLLGNVEGRWLIDFCPEEEDDPDTIDVS